MNEPKRGPKSQYDFTQHEIIVDASKLISFKNLVYRHNKINGTSFKFGFTFKTNSSKVVATKIS